MKVPVTNEMCLKEISKMCSITTLNDIENEATITYSIKLRDISKYIHDMFIKHGLYQLEICANNSIIGYIKFKGNDIMAYNSNSNAINIHNLIVLGLNKKSLIVSIRRHNINKRKKHTNNIEEINENISKLNTFW